METATEGYGFRGVIKDPSLADSWRAGRPIPSAGVDTIADGISVATPVPESVQRMRAVIDDVVLVDDSDLIDCMRLAVQTLGLLLEPAGAAGLAAIRTADVPGDRIATVLTGSNVPPDMLVHVLRTPPGRGS